MNRKLRMGMVGGGKDAFIGAIHRNYIIKKLEGAKQVYQLLLVEIFVMIAAISVGAWLSSSAPPVSENPRVVGVAEVIAGSPMLPAPNLGNVLWTYVPDAAIMGFLIFITALYIRGVVILAKRGDKWPIGRTIAFAFASVVVVVTSANKLTAPVFVLYDPLGHAVCWTAPEFACNAVLSNDDT